ncbi:MAG: indole-3-glycerol-phosphate synthase [Euzebyaceae bacterium]|nr:indole-3-glycerol-phosphate synthase [Euzebyaceae bacterium]
MSGFLAQACAEARDRAARAHEALPLGDLRDRARRCPPPPSFAAALGGPGVAVIAEVKRASPARGHLAIIPDAGELARAYASGGAVAISVLTEPAHFAGCLDDLVDVAAATPLPALRKDFVLDPYQVWEARAAGAAAVLLIVAALEQDALTMLLRITNEAGLNALVETHEEHEVTRAVGAFEAAGARGPLIIGINARDLTTLDVDPHRFAALRGRVPDTAIAVAESGVREPADVRRLAAAGADAVLVGEAVGTATDPAAAVRALVTAGLRRDGDQAGVA